MIMHVANLRQNYTKAGLHEDDVSDGPHGAIATWFQQATETNEIREPNAMVLSSVGPDGKPSSRVVLLKDFSDAGLTFFTNYASQKGLELTGTQYAALVFWWEPLERQVRIEGTVEKLPPERSDEYFASAPGNPKLGPGPLLKVRRSPTGKSSNNVSKTSKPSTPTKTFPGQTIGAAFW